ncbi:MAG: M23 family metallopeptidase [Proteobacteria bacterium]|nr:M23 family metallopeptidase [Pseudomonadota bacterium]
MKLNTLSKAFATKGSFELSYNVATLLLLATIAALALAFFGGYRIAHSAYFSKQSFLNYASYEKNQPFSKEFHTEQNLQVLTEHIGRIQANLMRINALGERLVASSGLDPQEFNFQEAVPQGGPLISDIKALENLTQKRVTQLSALHQALQTRLGHQELSLFGQGKSAAEGWVSSFFGLRQDPFTGRKAWHAGVDIVGKEGAQVKALAGGIVSYAATKGGYGHLVEIQHANGLATRYGHNKEILVAPGELVKKGQTIALLGSSGRSTGPHLHLEVHRNGEAVDPGEYFPDLRRK